MEKAALPFANGQNLGKFGEGGMGVGKGAGNEVGNGGGERGLKWGIGGEVGNGSGK